MAPTNPNPIQARLQHAVAIAREAGIVTLRHFREPELEVERKSDDSPVTVADRQAEELLRKRIAERFPEDGILGEEFGETTGSSVYRWVLDPIDGTKSFIHGVPLYTSLVAVLEQDEPRLGVIHAPACGETVYAATGEGAWYVAAREGTGEPRPARVSNVDKLEKALLLTSEIATFTTDRAEDALPVYLELQQQVRLARTWGDAYGYLMVATGRADIMIDPIVNLWDVAALQPIIEEAGGRFTDWQGTPTVHAPEAIGTNGHLLEQVLAVTRGR